MYSVRESWTDERLDDFAAHVDQRFDAVDRRFDAVDRRFDAVDRRFDALDQRFDALQRTLLQIGGGVVAALIAGFLGVIATQL
jgi:hypothetical protein